MEISLGHPNSAFVNRLRKVNRVRGLDPSISRLELTIIIVNENMRHKLVNNYNNNNDKFQRY